MRIKSRKNSTLKHFINYLRCLDMLELQEKDHNELENMCGIGYYHIEFSNLS